MSDFFDLIARRESCRDYDSARPVEREKLEKCLEAARIAPSACNSQPWKFYAVTRPETLRLLRLSTQDAGMNKFTDNAPVLIVVSEENGNLTERVGARVKRQDFRSVDIGLAVSQLCLAATAQGLSTCILGWFVEEDVKRALGIEEKKRIRLIIALGYARLDTVRTKTRKPLPTVAEFID